MGALLAPEFRGLIGVAREEIVVPSGIYSRCWGSAEHDVASGVHRPLFATALALGDEGRRARLCILTLDLSFWRSSAEELEMRRAILARLALDDDELILHQSHTHSAPSTALEFAEKPGGHLIAGFRASLIETCGQAARRALEGVQPATLTWATGSCRLAFDRNFREPGSQRELIGVNPEVAADDTLLVGRVTAANGGVLAVILNYACHPVSLGGGNTLLSPDYVGAARATVESNAGRDAICVFLHGASGDLTPRRSYASEPEVADQNGREVGYAALAALESMLPPGNELRFGGVQESGTALALWEPAGIEVDRTLSTGRAACALALRNLESRAELEAAIAACTDRFMLERLERRLLLRRTVGDGDGFEFRFLVSRIGGSIIVALPGEAHSPLQVRLRERFPGVAIAVMNIANGYFSYLPPAADYERDTYQVRVALFRRGCQEEILREAVARIEELLS
jgi:hypothetical protein